MEQIKLLIIDGNFRFIKSAINYLSTVDGIFILGGAVNTETGLNMITNLKPELVIIDLSINGSGGFHFVQKIKSASQNIKIIVTDLYNDPLYKNECIASGADDFIPKTEFVEMIIPAINQMFTTQFA